MTTYLDTFTVKSMPSSSHFKTFKIVKKRFPKWAALTVDVLNSYLIDDHHRLFQYQIFLTLTSIFYNVHWVFYVLNNTRSKKKTNTSRSTSWTMSDTSGKIFTVILLCKPKNENLTLSVTDFLSSKLLVV